MEQEKSEKSKALIVAEYFIQKSQAEGKPITNKKLQKLLYYAQAWSLVFNGRGVFEEKIEAWVHGPAIPSVYDVYKSFGFGNIDVAVNGGDFSALSDDDKKILEDVWKAYGKFDADYLEVLTHGEAPWQMARDGLAADASSNNEISAAAMKDYYGRRLQEVKKSGEVAQG
jgi:uncharacterized phage-associated protein